MSWKERSYCGTVRPAHKGREILLMGWVDAVRDHGNLLFIHLRDMSGIIQVVFNPDNGTETFFEAEKLRSEYVVEIRGRVANRAPGTENPNLKTGEIEVLASGLKIHSKSLNLPFPISEKAILFGDEVASNPEHVDEDLRLRYRYLDLRRPSMQHYLLKRYEIIKCIRHYLDELGFVEVETPFLTKSTPEGARDYLVPSRVHPGHFYALPQSPQLFKQLLMMGGMDRYFQIARCFRDEDLRPNRQPEFTQLDLEAAFIDESFIYEVIEALTVRMFKIGGITLDRPFPRMTYEDAMEGYGTDRPDLRFDMAFREVTDILEGTRYGIFKNVISSGGVIKGLKVEGGAKDLSKNVLQNEYALKLVPSFGGKGMTWMKMTGGELQSNIAQFFSKEELLSIADRFGAREGDVIMMIADISRGQANEVLCSLRLHVAERLNMIPENAFRPVWVTDFPLFELKDGEINSQHHPFTMPDRTDFNPSDTEDLISLGSRAYDLVMNGEELGGGSIRIHRMDIQERIFRALGMGREEVEAKFGFFLRALEYGAPPHGGLAFGLDRVAAMILGTPSIRDVIAFPKNRSALCPLTRAPSEADPAQLEELHLISGRQAGSQGDATSASSVGEAERTGPSLSEDDVRHVARLARLRLSDEETEAFGKDLNSVLDYVDSINEIDTDAIEPMSHVLEAQNVWREDVKSPSPEGGAVLENAPETQDNYFKVPKILEG